MYSIHRYGVDARKDESEYFVSLKNLNRHFKYPSRTNNLEFKPKCSSSGKVVFQDSTALNGLSSFALVRKEDFLKWLNIKNLEIVWLIGGEKQLIRTNTKFFDRLIYNMIFQFDGSQILSESWFEEQGKN